MECYAIVVMTLSLLYMHAECVQISTAIELSSQMDATHVSSKADPRQSGDNSLFPQCRCVHERVGGHPLVGLALGEPRVALGPPSSHVHIYPVGTGN